MVDLIGYPKYVLNSTWLDDLYDDIDITDDYMMNLVSHRSYARSRELKGKVQITKLFSCP